MKVKINIFLAIIIIGYSNSANAILLFVPIPNFSKPPQLEKIIETLEKSDETKAVAIVSEDKTFGTKNWIWGHIAGQMTQASADRYALDSCEKSLNKARTEKLGGKQLYDFGNKKCELFQFKNKSLKLPTGDQEKITNSDNVLQSAKIISKSQEFQLPKGWKDQTLLDSMKSNNYFRYALNATIDSGIIFAGGNKSDITDFKKMAITSRNNLEGGVESPKSSEIIVGNNYGIESLEYTVIGDMKTGPKMTIKYLSVYLLFEDQIVLLRMWSTLANFDFRRSEYDELIRSYVSYITNKEVKESRDSIEKIDLKMSNEEIVKKCNSLGFVSGTEQFQLCLREMSQ
jgi:hypothetical protein